MKSAMKAPKLTKIQYLSLPLSALEVIRIPIGPALGIDKIKPANKPAIDMVMILSIMKRFSTLENKGKRCYLKL